MTSKACQDSTLETNQPIANLDMCLSEEYVFFDEVNSSECDFRDVLYTHELIVQRVYVLTNKVSTMLTDEQLTSHKLANKAFRISNDFWILCNVKERKTVF